MIDRMFDSDERAVIRGSNGRGDVGAGDDRCVIAPAHCLACCSLRRSE
jgi:hypothetical protein